MMFWRVLRWGFWLGGWLNAFASRCAIGYAGGKVKRETLEAILDILQNMNMRICCLEPEGYDTGSLRDIEALREKLLADQA